METISTINLLITDLYPKILVKQYSGQTVEQMKDAMKMQAFIKKSLKERPDDEILKNLLKLVQTEKTRIWSENPDTLKSVGHDARSILKDIEIELNDLTYTVTINNSPVHGLVLTPDRRVSDEDLFKVNKTFHKNDNLLLVRDSNRLD